MTNILCEKKQLTQGVANLFLWILPYLFFIAIAGSLSVCHGNKPGSWDYFKTHFINGDGRVIDSIKSNLILNSYGNTVVLPGYFGFVRGNDLILNPSYWVFPAFTTFAKYQDSNLWQKLHDEAVNMIQENTFSNLNLPPDWLLLGKNGGLMFSEKSTLYGYDSHILYLLSSQEVTP